MPFLFHAAERKSRLANVIPRAFAQLAPFKRIERRLLLSYSVVTANLDELRIIK